MNVEADPYSREVQQTAPHVCCQSQLPSACLAAAAPKRPALRVVRDEEVVGSNPASPTHVMSQDIEDTANLCQGSRCLFLVWVRGVGW